MAGNAQATEPEVSETFINAPIAQVWALFTSAEGYEIAGFTAVSVDLRLGGAIQTRLQPLGGKQVEDRMVREILAYEPQRMLATRISQAPADFPHADAARSLWTVTYFTPSGDDMTHVRIVGLGYGDDAASLAARQYFALQNGTLLNSIARQYWPKCKLCEKE